jgi:hypothetical protein
MTTQVQYRQEYVNSFERRQSYLRDHVTTEAVIKGDSAKFLVVGTAAGMTTRGANGLIPSANRTDTQPTVTLRERHYLAQETSFDIFTGQSDRRRIMQEQGMVSANQEMDDQILTSLATASNTSSQSGALTFAKVVKSLAELWEGNVPNDGQLCCLWTPMAWAALLGMAEFSNSDYIDGRPLANGPEMRRWLNATHIMHTALPGIGTNSATCYIFHKTAVGHAIAKDQIMTNIGYNGEHDYSWARHSIFHGSTLLLDAGVLKYTHDDTA